MNNEQMQRFHELVREAANLEREEGERAAEDKNNDFKEAYHKGRAAGLSRALMTFWAIANEKE